MSRRIWILHVLGFWALAAVQPVLDLLGRSPEFFVAHGAGALEIFLVLAVLLVPVPVLLASAVGLAGLAGRRTQLVALAVVTGLLAALMGIQAAGLAGLSTWKLAVPAAVLAGAVAGVLYVRFALWRSFFTVLGLAAAVVPLVFLLKPGVRRLVLPPAEAFERLPAPDPARFRPSPVVVVLFDELPLVSLLDGEGRLDAALYPNITALARDGRWFRNATAVSDYTQWALPPILTGRYPRADALPNAADHPANLFALLGRTHRLEVVEAVTDLCPEDLCPRDPTTTVERLAGMASDIRFLWLHVVLPEDLRGGLPSLTNDWANFDRDGWRRDRRRRLVERRRGRPDKRQIADAFVNRISAAGDRPPFYYLHSLLTHFPHELLPSGQRNSTRAAVPGEVGAGWSQDRWAIAQHHQRHLLQVGHADAVVGRLVRRLRSEGLYDDALIVLTSDHGSAYVPGAPRRALTSRTAPCIVRVPLVVKLPSGLAWPDGEPGGVSDRNVEAIDIAPTVIDALGLDPPWPMDGSSLVDAALERPVKTVLFASGSRTETYDAAGPDVQPSLRRQHELFGGAENPFRIPRPERYASLAGRPVSVLRVRRGAVRVSLEHPEAYGNVDTSGSAVPFDVGGALVPAPSPGSGPVYVAVAVNGTVAAVTRTWDSAPGRFLATPPLSAWRDGPNQVDVFIVEDDSQGPSLVKLSRD